MSDELRPTHAGHWLDVWRSKRALTRHSMCFLISVDSSTMHRIEHGKASWKPEILQKLSLHMSKEERDELAAKISLDELEINSAEIWKRRQNTLALLRALCGEGAKNEP